MLVPAIATPKPGRQFTYAFAVEKGLLVLPCEGGCDARPVLGVRVGTDPMGLIEARRAIGEGFQLKALHAREFDAALEVAFSRDPLDGRDIDAAMMTHADRGEGSFAATDLLGNEDAAPVTRLINGLIHDALKRGASDIHIDPFADRVSIRYRIDGDLVDVISPPRKLHGPIVSRIKVMARLDIAERRLPQDGRVSLTVGARQIDLRVATLDTRHGERVALRVLDGADARLDLRQLGMGAATMSAFGRAIDQPNGVVLVTGPVGSGKTTTLYAALSRLNTEQTNIMTLEDPIEYGLPGISQTQMDHKVGVTFAGTLRSVLRHDPNIVMVGEIRDSETADTAFEFAATGRLALSTLHTNSAAGAITRLKDIGVAPYMLASTLRAVLAQRLIRRLCPGCKIPRLAKPRDYVALRVTSSAPFYLQEPAGCKACDGSGFSGRLALFELLTVSAPIRDLLSSDAPESVIDRAAFPAGAGHLLDQGRARVLAGETVLEEVYRACKSPQQQGRAAR